MQKTTRVQRTAGTALAQARAAAAAAAAASRAAPGALSRRLSRSTSAPARRLCSRMRRWMGPRSCPT
jgi:hypothetical protein